MNRYLALKNKHEKEVNAFPMFFAFSDKQFEDGMAKFGLKPDETDKIYKFGNTGGFYRRTDSKKLKEMLIRHTAEMQQAIEEDLTGDEFIYDMFNYELSNHEYCITWDLAPTLDCLGLTLEEVNADKRLLHGLKRAMRKNRYER